MRKNLNVVLRGIAGAALALFATVGHAQSYATDWVANTYGTNVTRVGSVARSMWVAPEGTLYTASMWDENEGGIAIYSNEQNAGSIGVSNTFQGGAITGNSTLIFAALQYNTTFGSGSVGVYNRSTKAQTLRIQVSADTTQQLSDVVTGLATWGKYLAASDLPGNRVRLYTTTGAWIKDIAVTGPGALAFDRNGNIWVAQEALGTVQQYSQAGALLSTIKLASGAAPASLYFDPTTQYLWIGDEGPDENIKVYSVQAAPLFVKTFGVTGGYLDTTTGVKGTTGDKRFTRVVGIGKDSAGNLYVLNNPWGGTWDLGRNGGTDIHMYNASGTLKWKLQSLNFEGNGAPDPATDASLFYGGTNVYSGTAGGTYVANTVDPFTYPTDTRINVALSSRGEQFGQTAVIGANRILVAGGQNPDSFEFYHFNTASGYIAIPDGNLPGTLLQNDLTAPLRNGFCLDSHGDVWAGIDKTGAITHWPLTGFDATGKPSWGAPITYPTPATIGVLGRIIYLPESDTMILADTITGSTDWTSIGTRVEVYHGWVAGNQTNPLVITLSNANPKSLTATGNYLFVGYVHTVPNIDAFNLTTGTNDITLIDSNPTAVYVGNDVDSMYGLRSYLRANGQYVVTKDNYNGSSIVVYRWTP